MRIALFPDEYLPDSTRVHAKMLHELAIELQLRGNKVVVITPGNPQQIKKLVVDNVDGIEVWYFRNGQTRGVSKIRRAINETLLSFNAWSAIKEKIRNESFDLCINYSPTIFFGFLMKKLKSKSKSHIYLVLRDMFPQWVIDEGMIKERSLIAKYFRYFERINYQASDCIGVMSNANLDLFNLLHPGYKNVEVLMNWADTVPSDRNGVFKNWREKWGLEGKIIFFYGGNIGHAQDMANLMRLAKNMLHMPESHFLFVGQGDEFELITQLKHDWALDNVTIKPSVSQTVYCELLTEIDVGLFSLSSKHTAHNFPGKLLGYMTESLPILGSVNKGNDVINVINENNAGEVFINGDDEGLLYAAENLANNKKLRLDLGVNSYLLLQKSFSVESAASQILDQILTENP